MYNFSCAVLRFGGYQKLPNITIFFILIFLTSCENQSDSKSILATVGISGRVNTALSKECTTIYEIDIPFDWICKEPTIDDALLDTKKPIYEFIVENIEDEEDDIHITIHNFPNNSIDERVPRGAQINRWKQQFTILEEANTQVSMQSFGGFSGLKFQGVGKIKEQEKMMLGWIMQLPQEHYFALGFPEKNRTQLHNLRADYTIKVVGSPEFVLKNQKSIEAAIQTFRLCKEIPKAF